MKQSRIVPSKAFYKECKKCANESYKPEEIISGMEKVIAEHGIESIDVNHINESDWDGFAMKHVFKYCKPKVFQCIASQFGHKSIDLYMIDNRNLKNNVLHYMIQELYSATEKNAIEMIDLVYQKQYEDILHPHGLLYQLNEYRLTPIDYCRARKLKTLARKLEGIKYVHFHELLIQKCHIPYVISHCIVGFVFVVVHAENLDKINHKWDVIVAPPQN
eukprot:279845_1